nr:winged helix-turn-helix transcriptional regulator [Ruegeria conchae]
MDDKDLKIIEALQKNSSLSQRELAKRSTCLRTPVGDACSG